MFISAVDSQTISPVKKFTYLKSTLRGTAAKAIVGLSVTAENYVTAKDILCDRFGKHDVIVTALYAQLQHFPTAANVFSFIKSTHNTVEKILRQLDNLRENLEHQHLLIQQILTKFLIDVTSKVEEWCATYTSGP